MKNFIYSLMTGKRKGFIFLPITLMLYLLSLVYAIAIVIRRVFYRF
jgi:hypothetical protein